MAAPQMAAPQMAAMMAAPQMAAPQMAGFLAARSSLTEALTRTHGCADAGAGEAAAAGPAVSRGEAMHALRELRRLVGGEDPALRLKPERGVDAGAATTTEGSPAVSPLQSPAPGASLAGSDEEQPVLVSANRRTMPGAPGAKGSSCGRWEVRQTASGEPFYVDHVRQTTSWVRPAGMPAAAQSSGVDRTSRQVEGELDDDDDDDIGGFASKLHRRLATVARERHEPIVERRSRKPKKAAVAVHALWFLGKIRGRIARRKARIDAATPRLRDPGMVVPRKWLQDLDQKSEDEKALEQSQRAIKQYEEYLRLQLQSESELSLSWFEQLAVDYPLWALAPLLMAVYVYFALDWSPSQDGLDREL